MIDALISDHLAEAVNAQVGREFGASLQYVSIASYFASESLPQLAAFFYAQAEEERDHAMKFVHFLVDAGADVVIPAIPGTTEGFDSAEQAVEAALNWEREVTAFIIDLVTIAEGERNYIARQFLDWFVAEQLEEVALMSELLHTVRRAGENNLLAVEQYMVNRPAPAADPTAAG
jgi:ferritin